MYAKYRKKSRKTSSAAQKAQQDQARQTMGGESPGDIDAKLYDLNRKS